METPSWIVTALIKSHMLTVSINLYVYLFVNIQHICFMLHIYMRELRRWINTTNKVIYKVCTDFIMHFSWLCQWE